MTSTLLRGLLLSAALATPAFSADLRIGLNDDADVLDPVFSRTFVGEIVMASMCDKLVGFSAGSQLVPALATGWTLSEDGLSLSMTLREGVTFQDGTPFNADAVVHSIMRAKTAQGSRRASELSSVKEITAKGTHEVVFTLNAPDATLIPRLVARAGVITSPTAVEAAGENFGAHPVCVGPYKFKERVAQDRIVLEKDEGYYNAAAYSFDTVTFLPIPDSTVRLANLRSGDLDMIERIAPADLATVTSDNRLAHVKAQSLGYQGMTINIANGEGAGPHNPLSQHKELRQALSYAIDRDALNQVVFEGLYAPGNQPFAPGSFWNDAETPVPQRDVAKARELIKSVGLEGFSFTLTVPNNQVNLQVAQVLQAMVAEAGIEVKVEAVEFASMLSAQAEGRYQATLTGWSGYVDPDTNLNQFVVTGGGMNDPKFSNAAVDEALAAARAESDPALRKVQYDAARKILNEELPLLYLYHQSWIWGFNASLQGFKPYADGLIRLEGVTKG
ncbi:ABC transporter substrate-binding protein [Falsigemmobacter intermedius]|uniref:ABC transporter substrate-binding protein n=1 Tax=Falsigemmobacter intermedius TaxID=1553448 RepID=A0A444MC06_9RHOB|nr:ABC transporter substrate-binding protein [Falsigemmobacter intermedius]RWY41539.1 ABC transporter substrate-binding protein [Falsigemmobacter intermedius]